MKDVYLEKSKKMGGGYITPKKDKRNFQFGDGQLPFEIIQHQGHWKPDVPILEVQNQYFETMHCTVFSTIKCILIIIYKKYFEGEDKEKFFEENNKSERFTGVMAGLTPNGGSPQKVADSIRKGGLLPQKDLPWTPELNTFWEYSAPRPMTEDLKEKALKWLDDYNFGYEFVKSNYGWKFWQRIKGVFGLTKLTATHQDQMVEALKTSPLGVSVFAWQIDSNGLAYKNSYNADNHWACLVDYEYGSYWLIYDNYNNCWIKCRWDYPFGFIIRYNVKAKKNFMSVKTIKTKEHPEIYLVSPANNLNLTQIKAMESYDYMLREGIILPVEDVETLEGFNIIDAGIGVVR